MNRRSPLLPREGRPSDGLVVFVVLAVIATLAGCREPTLKPFALLSDPVLIEASESPEDAPARFRLRIRGANAERPGEDLIVRTSVGVAGTGRRPDRARLEAILRSQIVWKDPYLFVRETNAGATGWRAQVDHVLKVSEGRARVLGTVAAQAGIPGWQFQDGRFIDVYDRLEYTFFASHAEAPRFEIVLEDREGRFVVDLARTWSRGLPHFESWLADLRRHAEEDRGADARRREAEHRRVQALALRCLAFSRYCDQESAYQEALGLARRTLGEIAELVEEVSTVEPGELAPSRDEVLRANPALVNLFKETPDARAQTADGPGRVRIARPESIGLKP